MHDPTTWDCSYHDFLKEVRCLPASSYCARRLAWEDYVWERVREVLALAAARPGETNAYSIATPAGGSMQATVSAAHAESGGGVYAALWLGDELVHECVRKSPHSAGPGVAHAVIARVTAMRATPPV